MSATEDIPAAKPSLRERLEDRFERLIDAIETDRDDLAEEEIIPASENQTVAIVAIAVALVGTTIALVVAYTVGGEKLVERFGYLGAFVFAIIGSASMFIPVPGALAGITLGLLLDPIPYVPLPQPVVIALIVAAGSAIGELTGYSTGVGGRGVIGNSRIGRMLVRLMRAHGTLTVFCVAAVPNPFIDVGGIAAGVAGMSMQRFMLVMFAGKTINYIAVAYVVNSGIEGLQKFIG